MYNKKITLALYALICLLPTNPIQASNQTQTAMLTEKEQAVVFYLKNNTPLPQKITLIGYNPQDNGSNSTRGFMLMPYSSSKQSYEIGTKLYIATSEQIDIVMSGKSIQKSAPFLVVSQEMSRKTYNAFK